MIVNLRGTSGSGKSYIVRQIMDVYGGQDNFERFHIDGRKQPIGYLSPSKNGKQLYVPGHYETACGGCDTIHGNDTIFNYVRGAHTLGYNVLFEGLLITVEYNRTVKLQTDGFPLRVFAVNISLQECLDSILIRRRVKNPDALPVPPKNTTAKHKQSLRTVERLLEVGIDCRKGNREEVLQWTKEAFGVV